jgi:NAD(P)-dependent dehydrogenase (short-subunit alcohol dehydrogenase family)
MNLGLEGKTVAVTGSAGGLGREFALGFAREGCRLVVSDVLECDEVAREIEDMGAEVLAVHVDVTSESDVSAMAERAWDRFGSLDVLVNNAGIYGGLSAKFFTEIDVEEWDRVMAVHAKGTFLCCKAVYPYMKRQGAGKIVNIGSAIVWNAFPGIDQYTAAKGAVLGLTRTLARSLGPFNINVNAVAPGMVMTEASLDVFGESGKEAVIPATCLKRHQQPDSPVGAVLFFASRMSDDISGQTLLVDCGATMH